MDIILLQMQISDISLNKEENPPNEFPLSSSDIMNFKDTYQQLSIQKKKSYLQAILSSNQDLVKKIKDLDRRLNLEIESFRKKIVPTKRKTIIPKIQEMETPELRQKFKEMQKLKHQLEIKKSGTDSLEFLIMIKKQHMITLNSLQKEMGELKHKVSVLQGIKNKTERQEDSLKKEILRVGEVKMFGDEIGQLRKKVQQKNQQIKKKKEMFINLYKKNRSSRSVIAQPTQKQVKSQQTDPELAELKKQYQHTGKKIDILKAKKANIIKTTPDPSDLRKTLDKLKQKYESLSKLSK